MPILSTLNALNPAMRTLAATVGTAFAIQAGFAAVAVPLKTEKYYDLSGSLTFISCTAMSLYFPTLRSRYLGQSTPFPSPLSFHPRQLLMSTATAIWAGRLGTFLFQRIQKHKKDSRFDDIKPNPIKFAGAWGAQALWVSLTALPVYAVNAIPAHLQPAFGVIDLLGAGLWVSAFAMEAIADRQKSAWREEKSAKKHDEKFISHGLWSVSRHPNYVGEVTMWAAQCVMAYNALSQATSLYPAWTAAAVCISPIFEYLLITKVSGVPMLEKKMDDELGGDPKYEAYKQRTPVFFPNIFRG